MKKFLSITLILALTLALFAFPLPASAAVTTQSTTNVLFQDDFDAYVSYGTNNTGRKNAMIANGWETQAQNAHFTAASSGSYVAVQENSRNMMLSIENTKDWAGYSVSGTISFSDVQEARTDDVYGVYVMYANDLSEGGYEVGFCLYADGTKKLLVRRRKSSDYSALLCSSRLFDFNTDGTVYNLKAEYDAGVINCYINGTLELSYDTSNDDVMLTKGSAGIRKVNTGAAVTFDNFKVEKAEKTVWFSENFAYDSAADMQAAGWGSADVMYDHIQNESFNLVADQSYYTMDAAQTAAWDDYSVESQFVITRNPSGTRQWFGVSGRKDANSGYVFMICPGTVGNPIITARLRRFDNGKGNPLGAEVPLAHLAAEGTYTLRLSMAGNIIKGYINGELVCSATDDTYTHGSAGYYTATGDAFNVVVDNFKISDYNPCIEFNQTFDNDTTAETLIGAGYEAVSSTDANFDTTAMANKINNGKLSLTNADTQLGLFSPMINYNTYTVQAEVVIDAATNSVIYPCGLLIGASSKTYKTGYYFEVGISKTGDMFKIRVRKNGVVQTDVDGAEIKDIAFDTVNFGESVLLRADVSYDTQNEKTTVELSVMRNGSTLLSRKLQLDGELKGYSAAWKNGAADISFDNFKAYYTNISYVAPDAIGDMDGDGIVTATDARYIRGYLLGTNDATSANINGDKNSDIRDLVHFEKVAEFYMDNNARDLVMQRYTQDTSWNGNSFKLLAIGNSFSEDSMTYLYNIAKDQGFEDVKIAIVYRGNTTLKNHYDWASANAAEYTYKYYNAEKQGWDETPNYTILEGIKAEEWDMISLQQNSTYAGLPSYFDTVLDYLEEYIHKNKTNPDCKLAYNVTWAYPAHSTHEGFAKYNNNQFFMYNSICEAAYQRIYSSCKFNMVFPTGTAIQNARSSFIGDNLNRDEHHLNTLGRYVAACTLFRTISGQPLTELNYVPDTLNIDDTTKAAILEAVNAAAVNPLSITQSSYTQN